MKKIICVILALLTVFGVSVMTGCSGNPENTGKTDDTVSSSVTDAITTVNETETETETETEAETSALPDVTYGGEEFRILSQSDGDRHYDVFAEEADNNDAVRDAVHNRNLAVEDRFKVKIVVEFDVNANVNAVIDRMVKSGADEYDLCFVHMVSGAALAAEHDFVAFEDLEYIDLSKPWWDKNLKDGFSIGNRLYMANGDISPSSFSTTSCLYFNKKMFEKYDLEYPYQLVRDGKWTLDKLIEYTKDMTADGDGDGKVDPYSTQDTFGLTSWLYDVPYSLYYGAGGNLVSKDENDMPVYDPDINRDSEIYNKIYDVIVTNNAYFENSDYNNVGNVFINGRAMFYDASLLLASRLREMNYEFGILPMPKFSEAQKEYRSFVNGASSMVCVPASCKNLERASIITEALASEAYKTVTPVLYETYLKRKITRDADSAEMIDYIVRNRVFDMGYINLFDGIGSYVRNLLGSKSTNVASTFEQYEKSSKRAIENLIKAYNKSAG